MTNSGPNIEGADPSIVYADEKDHQRQANSQQWSFVTPTAKKEEVLSAEQSTDSAEHDDSAAREAESDEASYVFRAANPPPESLELFAQLPTPPKRVSKLRTAKQYPLPHPLMKWIRGVPMNEWNDYDKPAMNLPTDAQQYFAIHMDRVGIMHVDDVRSLANQHGWIHVNQLPQQLLRHWKPTEGPNIPINPGTWHSVDEEMPTEESKEIEPPDLSGVPDAEFAALKEAVRREDIRKRQLAQADIEAQDQAAAEMSTKRVTVAVEEIEQRDNATANSIRGDRAAQLEASTIATSPVFRETPIQPYQRTTRPSDATDLAETPEHRIERERVKSMFMASDGQSDANNFTAQAKARMAELKRSAGEA